MDNIAQFAKNLLDQAGLSNLPQDLYQEKQIEMEVILQSKMGEVILENLSEQARLDYLDLLKEDLVPNSEKLQLFLQTNLPNYTTLIQDELQNFGAEYLEAMK